MTQPAACPPFIVRAPPPGTMAGRAVHAAHILPNTRVQPAVALGLAILAALVAVHLTIAALA